jgi:hypothetical protein
MRLMFSRLNELSDRCLPVYSRNRYLQAVPFAISLLHATVTLVRNLGCAFYPAHP